MHNNFKIKTLVALITAIVFLISCTSTTMIESIPSGAKIYIDGKLAGTTPYTHTDDKIIGSSTLVKLEKEGYETYYTQFNRIEEPDAGPIVCGLLFTPVWWLWAMKYKPVHTYQLQPINENQAAPINNKNQIQKSKADKLRELKQLLDEKIITQDEYEKEKKKILDSDN
jgi:hypothetical protein